MSGGATEEEQSAAEIATLYDRAQTILAEPRDFGKSAHGTNFQSVRISLRDANSGHRAEDGIERALPARGLRQIHFEKHQRLTVLHKGQVRDVKLGIAQFFEMAVQVKKN